MAIKVSIDLFGDEHFRRNINSMARRAIDMRPVMSSIGEEWQDYLEKQFETEGRWSGEPWRQLQPETAAKRGSAHPILNHTGEMVVEMLDENNIKVSHDSVTLELPRGVEEKAEAAQYGFTSRDGTPVPPRKIVDFGVLDHWAMRNKVQDYLVNGRIRPLNEYFTP